jgi:hypothetical protein
MASRATVVPPSPLWPPGGCPSRMRRPGGPGLRPQSDPLSARASERPIDPRFAAWRAVARFHLCDRKHNADPAMGSVVQDTLALRTGPRASIPPSKADVSAPGSWIGGSTRRAVAPVARNDVRRRKRRNSTNEWVLPSGKVGAAVSPRPRIGQRRRASVIGAAVGGLWGAGPWAAPSFVANDAFGERRRGSQAKHALWIPRPARSCTVPDNRFRSRCMRPCRSLGADQGMSAALESGTANRPRFRVRPSRAPGTPGGAGTGGAR